MTSDIDKAVQEALDKRDIEEAQAKEAENMAVTGGTYFWAIVVALFFPIGGLIYGIYRLAGGQSTKGWIYIGFAIVGFLLSFAMMSA